MIRIPARPTSPAPSHVSSSSTTSDDNERLYAAPSSPSEIKLHPESLQSEDSVTCQWDNCGLVFTHLPTLIDHIHNDHIGVHKSHYTCEWATCQRRGLAQTSRFALISHIRSHTGEKPFTCARPECDKSFTRSDALAKHMRLQHNVSPPASGRGGSRKRKRPAAPAPDTEGAPLASALPPSAAADPSRPGTGLAAGTFRAFKIEPRTPSETLDDIRSQQEYLAVDNRNMHCVPRSPGTDDDGCTTVSPDVLPARLSQHYEPATGLVLGRSPAMVMYLLMKAKHRYAMEQQELLHLELKEAREELAREKEEKEGALNLVLRGLFGSHAEQLIKPYREGETSISTS